MTFTFNNYPLLTPEQQSPYGNLLSNAMKKYQQGVSAHYAPQRQEADIFAKEMGPMAALAANPNFKQFDPDTSALISKKMQDYIQKAQQEGGHEGLLNGILHGNWLNKQKEGENYKVTTLSKTPINPGYAPGEDLYARYEEALKGSSNPTKVGISKIATRLEKNENPVTSAIANKLGGSKAADAAAEAKRVLADIHAHLRREGRTEAEIKAIIGDESERVDHKLKRLKSYLIPKNYGDKDLNTTKGNELNNEGNQQAVLLDQEIQAYKVPINNFLTEYNASHPQDAISLDDLKHTAITHNMTIDEVMQQLQGGQ